jgi:hypothetical protein
MGKKPLFFLKGQGINRWASLLLQVYPAMWILGNIPTLMSDAE